MARKTDSETEQTAPGEPREQVGLGNLWRFMSYSLPYWRSLLGAVVTGLMRLVLWLSMPIFMKAVIDYVAKPYVDGVIEFETAWTRFGWMALAIGCIMVVHFFASVGRQYFAFRATASAIRDIRFRLFRHLQRLSLGFHTQRATGGIVSRVIADVQSAQQSFDLIMVQLSQQLLQTVVIVGTLLYLDWVWALVTFAVTPLFVVTTRAVRRPMRRATRRQRETVEEMSGLVQERFSMIREVQSFTAETHEERRVLGHAEELRRQTILQQLYNGLMVGSADITRFLAHNIVLAFGVYRITTGSEATLGDLPLFYMYTAQALQPMQFFANLYTQMQIAAAAADRVFHFIDTEPEIRDQPHAKPLQLDGAPRVCFENVRFAYPTDDPAVVLQDVSFDVTGGSKVVLVGESGAGKSTLMSLLPRFYDIQDGHIRIDEQDIREVTVQSLRRAVGIVPQEPVLFTGTIGENIRYGRPKAKMHEIRHAAEMANADAFIQELEASYDTEVGERGVGLSGGQVQRVAIARAFLKNPAILIMDEPTSSLDATSEALVMDALSRLAEGRTTFIIAHRLSVARDADLIVALDQGRVAERGTHEQLLEHGGIYARLWQQQVGDPAGAI